VPGAPTHPLPSLTILILILPPQDAEEVPVPTVVVARELRRERVRVCGVDVAGADYIMEVGLAASGDPWVEVAVEELLLGRLEVVAQWYALLQIGTVVTGTHLTVPTGLCWPVVTVTMRHSSNGRH
jgi:hypothetical protein